jgi:hypothetical protein
MKLGTMNLDKFEKFKSAAIKDTSKIKGGVDDSTNVTEATDAADCDKRRPRPGGGPTSCI